MCDIINLTDADIKQLKKNNNTDFYDCVWSMTPISTEYLHKVQQNGEGWLNTKRYIVTFEKENKYIFIDFFFDDLLARL